MKNPSCSMRARAFTLIELVAVMAIIAIIAAFTIPAVTSMMKGSGLTQGSQMIVDQLALSRQVALSRNMTVEVRFYRFGDPETPGENVASPTSGKFRAMQAFEILSSGVALPLNKFQKLPQSVIFSGTGPSSSSSSSTPAATLSSLIDGGTLVPMGTVATDNTAPQLPRGVKKNYDYVAFRFLPDGSTNLTPNSIWYITLHGLTDQPTTTGSTLKPPPNFFTVQIDPVNGTTRVYRPTAG